MGKISKESQRSGKIVNVKLKIRRTIKTVVHEQTTKKKHLELIAHCTSLMEKLEEKTQELVQKQQKLDQTKQEPLDWGYSLGTSVYEEHRQDRQGLHSQTRRCSTTTDRLTRAHKLCLYSGFREPIKQSRAIFAASALLFIFLVAFHFWLSRFLRLLSVSS